MLRVGLCLSARLPAGLLMFLGFVSFFGSIDHRLQQFELLPCGAVQTVDFFDHIVGVGGCDPFSEFVPSLFRFGVMYHHFNGGTLSHGSLTSDYIAITSFLRVTGCPLFAAVSAQNIQGETDQQSHINAEHFSLAGVAHKAFDAGFIDREDLLQKNHGRFFKGRIIKKIHKEGAKMAEKKFIPVKVTDREWAEKLLDGEVFMRPLYEFGAWNLKKEDKQLNNSFRGDLCEGMSGIFGEVEECPIYDSFDENVKKYIKQIWYIDDTDIKYFKIFSLYCMEYDPSTNFFLKPNPKMCEFGDTAVIIADYNEFIERFGKALFKKYDSVVSMMDRVKFYNFRETRETNPLFEKHEKYSYQNELRMAFCELRENKFAMGINSDTSKEIVEDLTPVKLQIGNIRDIAYAIPIENFLKLLIPRYIPLRFPMRELYESQSNYDKLVSNTRSVMKNHKSPFVRPMLVIDGNARVTDEGILI